MYIGLLCWEKKGALVVATILMTLQAVTLWVKVESSAHCWDDRVTNPHPLAVATTVISKTYHRVKCFFVSQIA